MRPLKPPRPEHQLGLFHPPIELPRWEALPPEIRQAAMRLLVALLMSVATPSVHDLIDAEGDDE